MTIQYALVRNDAVAGEGRLVARVYSSGTIGKEDFVKRASTKGTTVALSDTAAVTANIEQVVEDALVEGYNIDIGLGILSVKVQGTFDGYADRFDPKRHSIVVRFRPSKRLLQAVRNRVRMRRIDPHELRPNLISFLDVVSGKRDSTLTSGGIGHLYGNHMKFDPADPQQGLYILSERLGVLRVQVVAENQPRKLIFLIPPLPAGTYRLAVRAACCGGLSLETGYLAATLAVADAAALLDGAAGFAPGPFLLTP